MRKTMVSKRQYKYDISLVSDLKIKILIRVYLFILFTSLALLIFTGCSKDSKPIRTDIILDTDWKTIAHDSLVKEYNNFIFPDYNDSGWLNVSVPHNWDKYHGYLRKVHGNRHGYAWYRKSFLVEKKEDKNRYFLWFEGVGSYAAVWVNDKKVGYHAGGRTSFTIDITDAIIFGKPNILAVRADHPAQIRNLPWVCGGCSDEWGFSEGSQPMGIFRPVHLVITNEIRIEPFGVHIWNDTTISEEEAILFVNTEIKNYSNEEQQFTLISSLVNHKGKEVVSQSHDIKVDANQAKQIEKVPLKVIKPVLWCLENPYLYTLHSKIIKNGKIIDETRTNYGIRWISWPQNRSDSSNQFLLNGKPVFINGIGEYEHMFGCSHAFTEGQIATRINQIKAAGFNAFRDAHQPHNLRYQEHFDSDGILWWTQMSAHIWFDNPEFRQNFKNLLRDWIKERRNCPSNIMWGLQNESTLPTEFAEECVKIIRELDPTASSQRPITTCNGGTGTDWNVIQNWSGTYGGDPSKYGEELSEQLLNGEYGAWRSIDLHTEGSFNQKGDLSENRMMQLMEMKVQLAELVKNKVCGQYLWLLSSHDNPGRIQNGEGYRDVDRLGPINYKGILTLWGEPLDVYYMYRANYAPKETEPMVYIVSHTWPNRWGRPGIKDSIIVYSNCEEVELLNDFNDISLGKKLNRGIGKPFLWEKVDIKYNLLHAKAFNKGKLVAEDIIILHHLPKAPGISTLSKNKNNITKPASDYNYLYRINCGGPDYIDENGNLWSADKHKTSGKSWGSKSWTDQFENLPPFYGSQRKTFDPIRNTTDWKLFQTFRYGREFLEFDFPVANGKYLVELYFVEPWYGTGGGLNCKDWRLFDVAVNNEMLLDDFDIWKESGHDNVIKKDFLVDVKNGYIRIHFPEVKSGQAVISAIGIASKNLQVESAEPPPGNIQNLDVITKELKEKWKVKSWCDIGDLQFSDSDNRFRELPSNLFGADWIQTSTIMNHTNDTLATFVCKEPSDIFIALNSSCNDIPQWLTEYNKTPLQLKNDDPKNPLYNVYSKRVRSNGPVVLNSLSTTHLCKRYTVFVIPISSLEDPTDQRPTKTYQAEAAEFTSKDIISRETGQKSYVEFKGSETGLIRWEFYVGLASTYAIGLKYNNILNIPLSLKMKIETVDGIKIHEDVLEFSPTGKKWKTLKTSTYTQINAGYYKLILENINGKGIKIDALYIQ